MMPKRSNLSSLPGCSSHSKTDLSVLNALLNAVWDESSNLTKEVSVKVSRRYADAFNWTSRLSDWHKMSIAVGGYSHSRKTDASSHARCSDIFLLRPYSPFTRYTYVRRGGKTYLSNSIFTPLPVSRADEIRLFVNTSAVVSAKLVSYSTPECTMNG